jgi:hypothetical protein
MMFVDDLSSLVASTPFVVLVEDGQVSTSSSCLDLASQAASANIIVFMEGST